MRSEATDSARASRIWKTSLSFVNWSTGPWYLLFVEPRLAIVSYRSLTRADFPQDPTAAELFV